MASQRLSAVILLALLAGGGCSSANDALNAPPASGDANNSAADLGSSLVSAGASAPGVRASPVVPGRPGRVFIFAGVDKSCAPLPAPELQITTSPAKGDISFRPGQETIIAASLTGSCPGAKSTGTGVYYTARAGATGTDTFAVTAKLASGEVMRREFQVTIAE